MQVYVSILNRKNKLFCFCLSGILLLASSCSKHSMSSPDKPRAQMNQEQFEAKQDATLEEPQFEAPEICSGSQKILQLVDKPQLLPTLEILCRNGTPTELFEQLKIKAFTGVGEPSVNLVEFKVTEPFVTQITVAFALKVNLNDPSEFYALKTHDSLASGIQAANSEVIPLVESRKNFPGRRSVEEVILNYSLKKSEGGGLYDKRRTKFNTYLLDEQSTDHVIATEELLDAAQNRTYHDYKGLLLGIKAEPGYTYLVFVNDYIIKNRIDPLRLQRTLIALTGGMQKKITTFFASAKAK